MLALGFGPRPVHVAPDQLRVDFEQGAPDVLDEGEVAFPVAARQIIEEDAADTPGLAPVAEMEILVAPFLEARVIVRVVGVTGGFQGLMEVAGVVLVREAGRQVHPPAEPGGGGGDVARVHMHRRHQGRARMGDERDAARPESRVFGGAGDVTAELLLELAEDGRHVDAHLFEHAAVHDRHDPAAAAPATFAPALPALALEPARRPVRSGAGERILQRLEGG